METRKIGIACFIGGVVGMAAALAASPMFWWLGLLVGFAGGYVSYRFSEVLRAIPMAWSMTLTGMSSTVRIAFAVGRFIVRRNSAEKVSALAFFICVWWFYNVLYTWIVDHPREGPFGAKDALFVFEVALLVAFSLLAFLYTTAERGAERCYHAYFLPYNFAMMDGHEQVHFRIKKEQYGLIEQPLSYLNLFRWSMKGTVLYLYDAGRSLRYYTSKILLAVWSVASLPFRFAWNVFILVHSNERLLCGVDSALGTLVAYVYFAPGAETLSQYALVCVAGGIIGAFLGIVNYEIFSIRLLKVVPVRIKS